MKLVTKKEVTYNDQNTINGTKTGIVEGVLIASNPAIFENDFDTIGANYEYKDLEGNPIFRAGFRVIGEDIETLYNEVKNEIPEGSDFRTTQRYLYYLGFRQQMALTFGINPTEIDLIP